MNFDKEELIHIIRKICSDLDWKNILYAGVVGSAVVTQRNKDIDVLVITTQTPDAPSVYHQDCVSLLVLNTGWLNYDKHSEKPTGLVPSILFKSIELSKPIIGNKDVIEIPMIKVCKADWINVKIKKKRYENVDRKNFLVALLFEKLLKFSPDLSRYSFNNIEMGKNIGSTDIVRELIRIYDERAGNPSAPKIN